MRETHPHIHTYTHRAEKETYLYYHSRESERGDERARRGEYRRGEYRRGEERRGKVVFSFCKKQIAKLCHTHLKREIEICKSETATQKRKLQLRTKCVVL